MIDDLATSPPCGVFEMDDARRLVAVSDRAASWLGYAPDELVGREVDVILSAPARMFFFANVFPALTRQDLVDEIYVSLTTRASAALPVVMAAMHDALGKTTRCAFLPMRRRELFEREILTAQRAAEDSARAERTALDEKREAEARMAHHERLAALGTLAAGVAHELNNPLAFVSANLDLLAERLAARNAPSPSELEALLAEARRGIARMTALIASMKSLARTDVDANEPVDLERVIKEGVRMVGSALLARVRLELKLATPLPWVWGNEQRWAQVVTNLVSNAAQAFPESDPAKQWIVIEARATDDGAALEVRDNGAGIPDSVKARIFDPFFTTKPVGVGTGLGLSICHGIVTAAGGTITVESDAGAGACFHVTMKGAPRPQPLAKATVASASSDQQPAATKLRVLVIDDEPMVARAVAKTLAPHEAVVVYRGDEGRRLLESGERFDVIVCDLMMPDESGMAIYEAVNARDPELAAKMIFLTGGASEPAARAFLARVKNERMTKPFGLAELRAMALRVAQRASASV